MDMETYKTRVFINMHEYVLPSRMYRNTQLNKGYKVRPVVAYLTMMEVEAMEDRMRDVIGF
jgi:hypothetical protein